jgi:1-acyl-sn-glycerol-3-phosphate acyltransferase
MNLPLPPRWVRRILIAPLVVLLALGAFLYVPIVLLLAAVFAYKLPGKLRALRLAGFALVYLGIELVGLTAAFGLWVASGFGWKLRSPAFRTAHYGLLRWALDLLYAAGRRLFVLKVEADGPFLPGDDGDPTTKERPLVIMSRHAGPGDSFLLVREVLSWAGRRPRIVLRDTLQLDPFIDVVLNRLPMRFVDPTKPGDGVLSAIAELSASMRDRDAFLIFPEGGNFTEERRERAIAHLQASGMDQQARRAERLRYVLPPRPGGVLTAIEANPSADVVFVAHTGLDGLDSLRDVWAAIPDHKVLHMVWRVLPAGQVPRGDRDAQVDLLYDAWEGIDQWIGLHREDDEPI